MSVVNQKCKIFVVNINIFLTNISLFQYIYKFWLWLCFPSKLLSLFINSAKLFNHFNVSSSQRFLQSWVQNSSFLKVIGFSFLFMYILESFTEVKQCVLWFSTALPLYKRFRDQFGWLNIFRRTIAKCVYFMREC